MAQDAESTAPSGPVKVPGAAPEEATASSPATTIRDPLFAFLPESDFHPSDQPADVARSPATRTVVEAVAVGALETPAKSVKLVSDDLILRQYGKLLSQLQQRVAETTASFQAQLGEFVIEQQRIEDAVVQLAQLNNRAVSLTRDLDRRALELDSRKENIDRTLLEAAETLSNVQERSIELFDHHRRYEASELALARLDQQAREATAGLKQRVNEALGDLERQTADTTTRLDKRIEAAEVQRVAIDQLSAELQRRAAVTTEQLEHALDDLDGKKPGLELQAKELDDRKDAINRALSVVAEILPDLQAQSSELSQYHQQFETSKWALARVEQQAREAADSLEQRIDDALGVLERRAVNASTGLDKRVEDAETRKAALEQVAGALEQRAAATTQALGHTFDEADSKRASLELQAKELDGRKEAINRILLEAASILPDLQVQSRELSEHHQRFEASRDALARLDQQTREAAGSLEHRVDDALRDLERRTVDASTRLVKRLEETEAQKVALEQLAAEVEQRTAHGVRRFEHSRDELDSRTASLEVRAKELNDGKQAIDNVLLEAASILPDLQAQSRELTEHHQRFDASKGALARLDQQAREAAASLEHRVDDALSDLERRTVDASSSLGKRLDDVKVQRAAIEQLATELQRRTDSTSHMLDERLAELDNKNWNLQQVIVDATQTLSTLQVQLARVCEREQSIQEYDRRIAGLEQRAADATGRLDERMKAFDGQRERIDRSLADVMQTAGLLSDLEGRITRLIGSDGPVDRGKDHVERLENLASAAGARLKQLTRSKSDLEREFANLHARVKKAVKAAQNDARQLSELNRQTDVTSTTQPTWSLRASVTAMWRRYQNLEDPLLSPIIVIGSVSAAILIAILLVGALSSRTSEARPAAQSLVALPSRPQRIVSVPLLISEPRKALDGVAPVDASPSASVVGTSSRTPASQRFATGREPLSVQTSSAVSAGSQAFVGSLAIDSMPQSATVFVNRRMMGETPLVLSGLGVGSYVIRLERQGFQPWTASATVSAIHQTQVTATLQANGPQ